MYMISSSLALPASHRGAKPRKTAQFGPTANDDLSALAASLPGSSQAAENGDCQNCFWCSCLPQDSSSRLA
jgi:hypothetical protein